MKNLALLIIAGAAAVLGYLYFQKDGVPISISESQINAAVAKSFPVSQTFLQVIDLAYSNPRVTLRPGSERVQLEMDAKLSIKLLPGAKNLTGTTIIDSGIRYQADTRQFFLADPTVRKLEIDGMPRDYVDRVTQVAVELTRSRLEKEPIYTVEGPEAAMLATNLLVKDVRVRDGFVQVVLGL
jgi:hypothetical protein